MEKPNTDNPGGRPGINLENPSSSKDTLRDSGNQQLFDKDSGNTMRSITPSNKKDNTYFDKLNNQQQKDFILDKTRPSSSGNIYLNHGII